MLFSFQVGKRAQFAQGEFLRRPYDSFLGDRYSPDYLKVQCTDVDRTKMSTMLFLAGLFPPKGDQVWNPNLLWQPIPLNYETMKYDRVRNGDQWKNYVGNLGTYSIFLKHSPSSDVMIDSLAGGSRTGSIHS
jgi:Histidine acid phosphatase.